MPSRILCSRCNKEHSLEDYERDRFCRNCGSLLLVTDGKVGVSTSGWRRLFPYKPYTAQEEFIKDIENTVAKKGVLLAEACNGFGKTISSLCCLLDYGKPIVYATRTHEQVRQVLTEIETINNHASTGFKAVNLASRSFLCINPECMELPSNEAQEYCQILRKDEKCPFISEIDSLPKSLPLILSKEALVKAGRRHNLCPYYLSRRASMEYDLVVAPYPYVFNPMIRMITGFDLEGKSLILDEGHNIDQVGQDILSDSITERGLSASVEELRLIRKSRRYIALLSEFLGKLDAEKPRLVSSIKLERDLENCLGVTLDKFIEIHEPMVDAIRSKKIESGNPPVCYLNGLIRFIELLQNSQRQKYTGLYTRNYYGANVIEYRCLDPSLAVKPVVEEAESVIIMSGTLGPMDTFSEIIGQNNAAKKTYPHIQQSEKIKMTIDKTVTTAYRERNEDMILRIGKTLSMDLEEVKQGALVFFTQRRFMNQCIDTWRRRGVITSNAGRTYLGGKLLFREGRDAKQNRSIVPRYKRMAVGIGGAVLCCVFRGRNSEGSNFPEDQARGIFLVGVPYANYGDPLVKAQMTFYSKQKPGLGRKWYIMDAFRAANQSLGRGIRGKDDWCHYWLLDRRYADNMNLVSKWAQGGKPLIRSKMRTQQPVFKKMSEY